MTCGCFYCGSVFAPGEIVEWIDPAESADGQRAMCPDCGIDSVLGSASGYPLTPEFLARMRQHWFGDRSGPDTSAPPEA